MKCQEFEKRIYLYEELTPAEKKLVKDHINQCAACSKLIEQISNYRAVIQKAKVHQPELQNPHPLTQRILNVIENEKKEPFLKVWFTYLDSLFFRYVISALSIYLISFFIYEQQALEQPSEIGKISKTVIQGAILDMSKFHSAYNRRRANRTLESLDSRYVYYRYRQEKNYNKRI